MPTAVLLLLRKLLKQPWDNSREKMESRRSVSRRHTIQVLVSETPNCEEAGINCLIWWSSLVLKKANCPRTRLMFSSESGVLVLRPHLLAEGDVPLVHFPLGFPHFRLTPYSCSARRFRCKWLLGNSSVMRVFHTTSRQLLFKPGLPSLIFIC